jgi:hypothetical protein
MGMAFGLANRLKTSRRTLKANVMFTLNSDSVTLNIMAVAFTTQCRWANQVFAQNEEIKRSLRALAKISFREVAT